MKEKQKMINNKYAKAYAEVLEIISDYNFTINPEIDLDKQNISKEANAIIVNLFQDYFATEEQKIKIRKILDLNQRKEEQEKKEKYNPNDIFKKREKNESSNTQTVESNSNIALIEYKESFFEKFKHFIFKILHIN